ncbi:MAG: hypothetical protein KAI27_03655 [Rhodospirillaceae bacterium]|nr:hypothetical protein [Rhodospirillaceae bacterium]
MTEEKVQRKLAAILAADVVGYSRLMDVDEESTLHTLRAHRQIIDGLISTHNGRVFATGGDSVIAEFTSPVEAVRCAVQIQLNLEKSNVDLPKDRLMIFRIGVNLGDIMIEGDDLLGDGVNVAARLEGIADQGGICISGTVYDQVLGKISQAFEFMGEQTLKNIEGPVRAYRIFINDGAAAKSTKTAVSSPLEFSPPNKPSIAILPFKSLNTDLDKDFVADGIRLGIQATLVQLSGLFLVNVPAMNAYSDTDIPAVSAGAELGVRYVLEGAVQQAGDRVRVTVQLTDVATQQAVWAESYDRVLDDVFALQDEITQEVISSLNVKLVVGEVSRIWFDKLNSPQARECFYRGISHLYSGTKEDNAAARKMFEKLYAIHPESVQGPSITALTHWIDASFGWTDTPEETLQEAASWAEKAVGYDDNNGVGHAVLGHIQLLNRKFDEAVATCSEGVELRASCPLAHGLLGLVLHYCGDAKLAVKNVKEALQLEKVYPPWLIDILAASYRDSGDIGLSIPVAKESLRLNPQNNDARLILCSDYKLTANHDQAKLVAEEIIVNNPAFSLSTFADSQPYKDPTKLNNLIGALRESGLPE